MSSVDTIGRSVQLCFTGLKTNDSSYIIMKFYIFNILYYMATIVRALWLAAERALFSCNDRAIWNFFSARRLFWVVSKSYERMGEKKLKKWQSTAMSSLKEKLAYRYFYSTSDEESHSARKRMWKITSVVFIVFLIRIALKRPYNN